MRVPRLILRGKRIKERLGELTLQQGLSRENLMSNPGRVPGGPPDSLKILPLASHDYPLKFHVVHGGSIKKLLKPAHKFEIKMFQIVDSTVSLAMAE